VFIVLLMLRSAGLAHRYNVCTLTAPSDRFAKTALGGGMASSRFSHRSDRISPDSRLALFDVEAISFGPEEAPAGKHPDLVSD
jgi:hypothetical protein